MQALTFEITKDGTSDKDIGMGIKQAESECYQIEKRRVETVKVSKGGKNSEKSSELEGAGVEFRRQVRC